MTDTPWTPGPWEFYAPSSWTDGLGYIRPQSGDTREIAHHGDSLRSAAENFANARLITAAPEMAELLERIDISLNCGCRPCRGDCTSDAAKAIAFDAIRDEARALLARIRGATP